jgi:hypothetical protein
LFKQYLEKYFETDQPFFYTYYNEPNRAYHPPLAWLNIFNDAFEMSSSEALKFIMNIYYSHPQKIDNGCQFSKAVTTSR